VGRIWSEAAFAALAGTSPLPASSGNTLRRRLNRVLQTIDIDRMRCDSRTREHVAKRTQEGRNFKRHITHQIYKTSTAYVTTATS